MTRSDLLRAANSASLRPCTITQAIDAGLRHSPILLDLAGSRGWPHGGVVIYTCSTDWSGGTPRRYGQFWAVCGHESRGKVSWYRAHLGNTVALDLPDRTEDERAAILAALPLQS